MAAIFGEREKIKIKINKKIVGAGEEEGTGICQRAAPVGLSMMMKTAVPVFCMTAAARLERYC